MRFPIIWMLWLLLLLWDLVAMHLAILAPGYLIENVEAIQGILEWRVWYVLEGWLVQAHPEWPH